MQNICVPPMFGYTKNHFFNLSSDWKHFNNSGPSAPLFSFSKHEFPSPSVASFSTSVRLMAGAGTLRVRRIVNLAVTRRAQRAGRPRYRIPRSTVSLTQQRAPIRSAGIVLSGWEFHPRGCHGRRQS